MPEGSNQSADANAGLEGKLASLQSALETEKQARAAEKKAYDERIVALETERVARAANDAAATLVSEGKVPEDKKAFWAGQYAKLGKESFDSIAAALPVIHVGVAGVKAKAHLHELDGQALDAALAKQDATVKAMMVSGSTRGA